MIDGDAARHPNDAAGLCSFEAWSRFFSGFSHLVLIANSDEQDFQSLRASYPDTALFIFFNRVNRVLDQPITNNSLLVTRSNQAGSELVYRGILGQMTDFLQPPGFRGVMSLRTVAFEQLMQPSDFGTTPAGVLDLADYFETLYPQDHTASSGFALAMWLCEHVPGSRVVLSGFSAKRGRKWKVFLIHDWVFEQSVLHLLAANGRLEFAGRTVRNPYAALRQHFPDIGSDQILFASVQALSLQLEGSKRHIDELVSITAPLSGLRTLFRKLKGKSKKDRILAARKQDG